METGSEVIEVTGNARALIELLEQATELTIICHDNPDPDCLASALALGRIAAEAGVDERRILYSGMISHQQNRAFVNLLDIELTPFDPDVISNRAPDSLLAFVDHTVPGANNEVPPGTPIDIVIDHHPAEDTDARFIDQRESVGATATVLTEYLGELEMDLDPTLSTGLLFAIRRETLSFLRGTTRAEYSAARVLHEHADLELLHTLSSPSVSGATIDAIARAIGNRTVRGSVLLTHVGRTSERDALPQASDYLATLEGVETAIVSGIIRDAVEISGRSTDSLVHIGNVFRDAFDAVGSAGGHRGMAGGQIPLGIFADCANNDQRLVDLTARVITDRLIERLQLQDGT